MDHQMVSKWTPMYFPSKLSGTIFIEIAQNFKEQGNDYFKGRRYREALGFYTQGIDVKPTDPAVREILLCNRAACNIELSKYRWFPHACILTDTVQETMALCFGIVPKL
jgi:hypothetical protein